MSEWPPDYREYDAFAIDNCMYITEEVEQSIQVIRERWEYRPAPELPGYFRIPFAYMILNNYPLLLWEHLSPTWVRKRNYNTHPYKAVNTNEREEQHNGTVNP